MAVRQTQKLLNVHSELRQEFDKIQDALTNERQQCINDRRFYSIAGAQWEGKYENQFKNKPRFEINKIHLSVIRIFNEYRNNRITVDFVSKEGIKDDPISDTCDKLYRADEQRSSAQEAYDNAFEEGVGGGIGAWRLYSKYEDEYDEENENQNIVIEPIYDADTSVFFDLDAKKYDKSDAKYCFILSSYTPEAMKKEWGEDVTTWPKELFSTTYFDWNTPDVVYVSEAYVAEEVNKTIYIYRTVDGNEETYTQEDFDDDVELEDKLDAIGTSFERERKIKQKRIHKYIMSGTKILEDCGYIAGKEIPIVPFYGKRWFIDNVERCMGHVRLCKDAQRLKNMQMSKLAEISALSSVEKPILTPEQIKGHQLSWAKDNIENAAYLLLNPIEDINGNPSPTPPLAYTKVPNVPPAMAALLQLTDTDIKELLGNQEAGEKIIPNLSGKAVQLIQNRLDMQTFIYMSNMAKSMKRCGEIWLSMAQELYVEPNRRLKGIDQNNNVNVVELLKPMVNKETSEVVYENDLSKAKCDVVVSVGASSSSKREAMIKSIIEMLPLAQQDPDTAQVLTSIALMNMEGEGLEDAREYIRGKLLRKGVVKPTEEESQQLMMEMQNQTPDPQAIALQGMAEEAQAKAAQARANTVKTIAESEETQAQTEKIKAETAETLSKIDREDQLAALDAAKTLESFTNKRSINNPDILLSENNEV